MSRSKQGHGHNLGLRPRKETGFSSSFINELASTLNPFFELEVIKDSTKKRKKVFEIRINKKPIEIIEEEVVVVEIKKRKIGNFIERFLSQNLKNFVSAILSLQKFFFKQKK